MGLFDAGINMYIFVSSIGRSGTKFLAELFSHVTEIPSYHAKEPLCIGETLQNANNFILAPEIEEKIKQVVLDSRNGEYFESTQIFLRVLVDQALNELNQLGVIHLTRDPLEVAKSYTNRKSTPGNFNYPWRLSPSVSNNYLKISTPLTLYQLNLWDWFENEIRYHYYSNQFKYKFNLLFSDFGNVNVFKDLFTTFHVNFDVSKLNEAFSTTLLQKNENPIPTVIDEQDYKEAEQFKQYLHASSVDISFFRDPYYLQYPFVSSLF